MSLSRFAPPLRAQQRAFNIVFIRSEHAITGPVPRVDEKPGFFKKISFRFQGIPLAGETHAPKSLFDNMGIDFIPPPLPSVPKDYKEYPERDLVNFPYPEHKPFHSKTRMLVFPDSWFTPFQKVTGASGPYLFFGGVFAFMLNKEIWVLEENGMLLLSFIQLYWLASRIGGYKFDKYCHTLYEEKINELKGLVAEDLKGAVQFHKTSAAESASLSAIKTDFPTIFKENLALQLEAVYRKNVDTVYTELKRRLDYLKEVEETKKKFERDIFLQSIFDGVQKSIETNDGNIKTKYLDNCIAQIKELKI